MFENTLKVLLSPTSIDFAGFKFEGPAFLLIPLFLFIIFAAIASIGWIYKDAASRNKNGFIAVLFIFLAGFPLSLIWWLWLRPPIAAHTEGIEGAEQGAAANP